MHSLLCYTQWKRYMYSTAQPLTVDTSLILTLAFVVILYKTTPE